MSHVPTSDRRSFAPRDQYPSLRPTGDYAKLAEIPLHRPITLVGSRRTARVHLNSSSVSRAHALLVVTQQGVYISDLNSREGTLVNGRKVRDAQLQEGDALQIGRFTFEFHDPRDPPESAIPETPARVLRIQAPEGSRRIPLTRRVTLVGRRPGSDIHLPYDDVSTANTAIVKVDGFAGTSGSMGFDGYAVFDLGGRGTILNDRAVHKGQLSERDVLRIGPAVLTLGAAKAEAPRAAASAPAAVVQASQAEAPADEEEWDVETISRAPAMPEDIESDGIALGEDLTDAGVEEDLLGGSFAMEALAEPQPTQQTADEPPVVDDAVADEWPEMPAAAEDEAAAVEPAADDQAWLAGTEVPADEAPVELAPEGEARDEAEQPAWAAPVASEDWTEEASEGVSTRAEAEVGDEPTAEVAGSPLEEDVAADDAWPLREGIAADVSDAPSIALRDEEPVADVEPVRTPEAEAELAPADEDADGRAVPQAMEDSRAFAGAGDDWPLPEAEAPREPVTQQAPREEPAGPVDVDLSRLDFAAAEPAAAPLQPPTDKPPKRRKGTGRRPRKSRATPEIPPATRSTPSDEFADASTGFDTPAASAPTEPLPLEPDRGPVVEQHRQSEPAAAVPTFEYLEGESAPTLMDLDLRALEAEQAEAQAALDEDLMQAADRATVADEVADLRPAATDREEFDRAAERSDVERNPALADPMGSSGVLGATDPTPDSALDLADLDLDADSIPDIIEDKPGVPSDSQFLRELELLSGEESEEPVARHKPAPAPTPKTAPSSPGGDDWRREWASQHSAFLGNMRPLPLQTPAVAPPQEPAEEQAPEGLSEAERHTGPLAPQGRHGGRVPREPTRPAAEQPRAVTPGSAAPATVPEAPRPKKVGFGGPIAEVEATTPAAQGPFASTPFAGAPALDASAAMPETSGLLGVADVFSLPPITPGTTEPLIPETGSASAPVGPAMGAQVSGRPESRMREAGRAGAHQRGQAGGRTRDEGTSFDSIDDESVDAFLKTVRGGVSGLAQTADAGINGHSGANGRAATAADFEGLSPATEALSAQSLGASEPTLLHAPGRKMRGAAPARTRPPAHLRTAALPLEDGGPSRRRSVWMIPLLVGLMVLTMIGAVAGIWLLMPPSAPVTLQLKYDIPPALQEGNRQALRTYQADQMQRLGNLRQPALDELNRSSPSVDPAYLGDEEAYGRFLRQNVTWDEASADTLVLSRVAADRSGEIERLKAVAKAIYDLGRKERATAERLGSDLRQRQSELEGLIRDAQDLTRQIEELTATMPEAMDPSQLATRQRELQERIGQLDEQWNAADRRVAQLQGQLNPMEAANPLEGDSQLAQLRRRLSDIEAKIAALETGGIDDAAIPAAGVVEAGAADADSRGQRAAVEEAMDRLRQAGNRIAARLDASSALVLQQDVARLSQIVLHLLDETLPRHLATAGEVEMARQALTLARRNRLAAVFDADEILQSLRSEVALRERELGAAVSDGLHERSAGLRMALKLASDRLTLRREQLERSVEADEQVAPLTRRYASADAAARQLLTRERDSARSEFARVSGAILSRAGTPRDPGLAAALSAITATAMDHIEQQAERLPVAAEIWSEALEAAEPAEADGGAAVTEDPERRERPANEAHLVRWIAPLQSQEKPDDLLELQTLAAQLRREIEQREAELRGAHEAEVAKLRQELAAARAAATRAQREAQAARTELGDLQASQGSAERQAQALAGLRSRRAEVEGQRQRVTEEINQGRSALESLATPRPPSDADIEAPLAEDHRFRAIMITLPGILAVFLIFIFLALRSEARA